ncbi:hypothetical protein THAOC_31796 [Thalassiosira oceanica]|uniref:Uncharacterized protein n=1 Tax=Thalassiosira oceanica TaxID=159749 RepID=K0RAK1_THAOC|nr:hypothetical protein THAOC_31796 [Thalassiosira oceanica]|eukprot:EJK49339.1 hypothetical protein THAOC_31796 [Thalassiosira oceanica]
MMDASKEDRRRNSGIPTKSSSSEATAKTGDSLPLGLGVGAFRISASILAQDNDAEGAEAEDESQPGSLGEAAACSVATSRSQPTNAEIIEAEQVRTRDTRDFVLNSFFGENLTCLGQRLRAEALVMAARAHALLRPPRCHQLTRVLVLSLAKKNSE